MNFRFVGETFPWLEQAARHGLWADGGENDEEEKKADVVRDNDAAVATMEEMKEKWGFPRFEEAKHAAL